MTTKRLMGMALVSVLVWQPLAFAVQDRVAKVVMPSEIIWSEGPKSLPAGAKMMVMDGDPSQPGEFTLRLQFPAHYSIPAHFHPADEHVTVLSGTLALGLGSQFNKQQSTAVPAGGFARVPKSVHHFAWNDDPVVIQLHGVGPWDIVYINPADDPRKVVVKLEQTPTPSLP